MESQMTNSQRAMQFWSVLVMAARTQQLLSYEMMERMTGIPKFGMGRPLGKVLGYCQQEGLPLLTSIVVDQSTGRPADLSFNVPSVDLAGELRRVFVYDWLKHGCPALDSFKGVDEAIESVVARPSSIITKP